MNTQASPLVPVIKPREIPVALIDALKNRFSEQCSTALVVREQQVFNAIFFTEVSERFITPCSCSCFNIALFFLIIEMQKTKIKMDLVLFCKLLAKDQPIICRLL